MYFFTSTKALPRCEILFFVSISSSAKVLSFPFFCSAGTKSGSYPKPSSPLSDSPKRDSATWYLKARLGLPGVDEFAGRLDLFN